ncbi:P-II family nitrogen regulator [Eubacteriaceae bacterium ES2]|nr:P-II family nitrogen regulator [Eubacteriaceae bacterium ES2]
MVTQISRVTIITRPEKFEDLRKKMFEIGVEGMTIAEVDGCGTQKGIEMQIRGVKKKQYLVPKVKIDIVVSNDIVQQVIDLASDVLRTGEIGDGKIFVSDIKEVVRIRTGQRNEEALTTTVE